MVVGQSVADRIVGARDVEERREDGKGVAVLGRREVGDPVVRLRVRVGCGGGGGGGLSGTFMGEILQGQDDYSTDVSNV